MIFFFQNPERDLSRSPGFFFNFTNCLSFLIIKWLITEGNLTMGRVFQATLKLTWRPFHLTWRPFHGWRSCQKSRPLSRLRLTKQASPIQRKDVGHFLYLQITFVTFQELAWNLTFTHWMVLIISHHEAHLASFEGVPASLYNLTKSVPDPLGLPEIFFGYNAFK